MFKFLGRTTLHHLGGGSIILPRLTFTTAQSTAPPKPHLLAENLHNRTLLRLHGKDALPVLQGLVTNDVTKLRKGFQCQYAMFLNKSGKALADAIIYRTANKNTFLLECDRNLINELKRRIRMYKHRDQELDIESLNGDFVIWAVFNEFNNSNKSHESLSFAHCRSGGSVGLKINSEGPPTKSDEINEEILLCRDPRLKSLGARVIVPHDFAMKDVCRLFPNCILESPTNKNDYKRLRYQLGVGEGTEDHPPGKTLPVEANCDFLNGFCFSKAGYIGHDSSSQLYHVNIRKRLMPLVINGRIDFTNLNIHLPNGSHVGKLIGRKGRNGLALLRIEQAMNALRLLIDGVPCELKKPGWWPTGEMMLGKEVQQRQPAKKKSVQN
ncbi:putative transferase CAF17 homolog, mitochondrial isoform X2 [Hermetia illucens]|uniref:putative transferase CAF17 homolog, mitochondrial isoform X2 n=1 Tax=Hermetia illucens TaxID=343691 RepID=UPI0018CC32B2|nr:putative transferase CAF17 homolog, mitochondrial isoform X2 [Hermetia illucens]